MLFRSLFLFSFTVFFLKSKCSYHDPVDGFLPPKLRDTEFKQMLFLFLRLLDRKFGSIPVTLSKGKEFRAQEMAQLVRHEELSSDLWNLCKNLGVVNHTYSPLKK